MLLRWPGSGGGSLYVLIKASSFPARTVTASLRVVPRRALDKGYTFRYPELEPALRDLLGR